MAGGRQPTVIAELRRRGAAFAGIAGVLRATLRRFPELPAKTRRRWFERLDRFHFRHGDDPVREAAFRRLLP